MTSRFSQLPCQQHDEVLPVLGRKYRVQVGIRTGVERVEENKEDLGASDVNEWVTGYCGQPEEGDWRPAGEVSEDE